MFILMIFDGILLHAAGMVSALIVEDEPEDVRPSDDAILSTAMKPLHSQDSSALVGMRRRESAPGGNAVMVDYRQRRPLLPGM